MGSDRKTLGFLAGAALVLIASALIGQYRGKGKGK